MSDEQVELLRATYEQTRARIVANYYEKHVRQNREIAPLPGAWDGLGEVPLTFGIYDDERGAPAGDGAPTGGSTAEAALGGVDAVALRRSQHFEHAARGPASFVRHLVGEAEWSLRVDMAAVCRLISRLNGHTTYEGTFAHFSYDLGDGTYLVAPGDIPFAAMRASLLVVTDAQGHVLKGDGHVDAERFRAFNQMRHAGERRYPMLLFTHTTFTDRLAQHGRRIRMVSQSAFNFAADAYGYFDAWGHTLEAGSRPAEQLIHEIREHEKVFVMLSHGGCIARGEDAAHVFALVHGVDAAAEIQVYAEMTGFPLMELSKEDVRSFPRHGYGDMTSRTKRMVQSFAANKRLLLCDWNQGFRNCGDSAFVL
jgi:ribulose-5-phosphate 4-epimerase/fuculose-1-phosphate aldolase